MSHFDVPEQLKEPLQLGRPVVLLAQVGSVNYNLHDHTSDKDYEVVLLPTFNDLFHYRQLNEQKNLLEYDAKFYLVNHLTTQLEKSNPNFLQLFFSQNVPLVDDELLWLFEERELLASANLPRLYHSMKGMFFEAQNRLEKSFQQNTVNNKALLQTVRSVDLLARYADNGFESFEDALFYDGMERQNMLSLKQGLFTREDAEKLSLSTKNRLDSLKDVYLSKTVDNKYLNDFKHRLTESCQNMFLKHQ